MQPKTARRNKKGVVKMDTFCPSRMICKIQEDGKCNVTCINSHIGHTPDFIDTEHHPVPEGVLQSIIEQLNMGASVDRILNNLRDSKDSRDNRDECENIQKKHTITKRQQLQTKMSLTLIIMMINVGHCFVKRLPQNKVMMQCLLHVLLLFCAVATLTVMFIS